MGRAASTSIGVVVGTAVTVGGLYWLYTIVRDREGGSGFGFGLGGSGKGDKLFKQGAAGVTDESGGTGGDAEKPGGTGTGGESRGGASQGGGGGTKPNDNPGTGGTGGTGQGGSKPNGTGQGGAGGSGGGIGGGSGGGIGSGEGEGDGGDYGEGGEGVEGGGGEEDPEADPYAGWGDILIAQDLDPPELTKEKLDDMHDLAYALVGDVVMESDLPPPLHEFDPTKGSVLKFWADIVLRSTFDLPPGKLDIENPTHKPWIELWVDLFVLIVKAEEEREARAWEKLPGEMSVDAGLYGAGALARGFPRVQAQARRRLRPRSGLETLLGVRR